MRILLIIITLVALASPGRAEDGRPLVTFMVGAGGGSQTVEGNHSASDSQIAALTLIAEHAGYRARVRVSSIFRMHAEFEARGADCYVVDYDLVADEHDVRFMDVALRYHIVIYVAEARAATLKRVADLKGLKIGVGQSSPRLIQVLSNAGALVDAVPDDGQNFQKLKLGRIDAWATSRGSARITNILRQQGFVEAMDLRQVTLVLMCHDTLSREIFDALNKSVADLGHDGSFDPLFDAFQVETVPLNR